MSTPSSPNPITTTITDADTDPHCTEIVRLPVISSIFPLDGPDANPLFKKLLAVNTVSSPIPGMGQAYLGAEISSPLDSAPTTAARTPDASQTPFLRGFVDFDHVNVHTVYAQSPGYAQTLAIMPQILAGVPKMFHARLRPWPTGRILEVGERGCTVVVTASFEKVLDEEEKGKWEGVWRGIERGEGEGDGDGRAGYIGCCAGWAMEEQVEFEGDGGEALKGTAFCGLFGWSDMDKIVEWWKQKEVSQGVGVLRGLCKKWEMQFVRYQDL